MAAKTLTAGSSPVILVSGANGAVVIPSPSPLTRLHYFDGKFLRADDLTREQNWVRRLVEYSNQAGGAGVVHGFNLTLAPGGDNLQVGPGLAIDPAGRVLLLPQAFTIGAADLIERSRRQPAAPRVPAGSGAAAFEPCQLATNADGTAVTPINDLYLITAGHAEALCGDEDVFGKLCEEACVTSTDRPYYLEGVIFRAIPLVLTAPLPQSSAVALTGVHLRSRVASAYYATEAARVASLISGAGLRSDTWCLGAAAAGGSDVPLGVLSRSGATTQFIDAWTARRERIETPPRRYWAWRMAMRPWDVFLAQVLQFQCQLHDLAADGGTPGPIDPCRGAGILVGEAADVLSRVVRYFEQASETFAQLQLPRDRVPTLEGGATALADLQRRAVAARFEVNRGTTERLLIGGGIVELPSAGYLPVTPSANLSVNEQVRRWMGEGVDLRFCIVRPDFVAHALEEAQHMERISLLQGLDDPKKKPEVDILVPNGAMERVAQGATNSFAVSGAVNAALFGLDDPSGARSFQVAGAARVELPERGSLELHLAAGAESTFIQASNILPFLWLSASISRNPFEGEPAPALVEFEFRSVGGRVIDLRINGRLTYRSGPSPGQITGVITGQLDTGEADNRLQTIRIPVTATLGQTSLRMTMDISGSQLNIELSRPTPAGPIVFNAAVLRRAVTESLAKVSLKPDAEVLLPANPLHVLALRALAAIERGTRDADFVETASPRLFPPAPPATPEARITATLPWVLFHRRRTKQCEPLPPVVAPPEARCYRVFHLLNAVTGGATVPIADIRRALLADDRNFFQQRGLVFRPVDDVEFQPALPALATSPADIRADWNGIQVGTNIAYAAIASQPAARAEGETLALARLDSLRKTLIATGVMSSAQLGAGPDEIDRVPTMFETRCSDGVAVIVTEGREAPPAPLTGVMTTIPSRTSDPSERSALGTATLTVTGGQAGRTAQFNFQFFLSVPLTNPDSNPPRLAVDGAVVTPAVSQRQGTNTWLFGGVNLSEPGPSPATRVLTISNLVGNLLGATAPVRTAMLTLSVTGASPLPIADPQGVIAIVEAVQAPFTLAASGIPPVPDIRAEGRAELMGEVLLRGTGGTPGTTLTTNIQAVLNAPITATAALPQLVLDTQPANPIPAQVLPAGNAIVFPGVAISAPPSGGARELRIRNLRADGTGIQNPPDFVLTMSTAGAAAIPITSPAVVVGRLVGRNGRLFATAEGNPRTMGNLATTVPMQFNPDSSLRALLTAGQVSAIIEARDRVGQVVGLELATRETAPDRPSAQRRLEAVMKELREKGIIPATLQGSIGTLSAVDRALLPADAGGLEDFVFVRLGRRG